MKNDLTCAVVRDLLPSYVEGLTSEETNAAVDAHLASCADCAARKDAMTAPEDAAEQVETAKEVDYLKKVKRRRWKWAVGAVLCTLALMAAGVAAKLFIIGEPASAAGMAWQLTEDQEKSCLRLRIDVVESAMAYRNWKIQENDGVMTITARKFLVSPLGSDSSYETELRLDGLREVWLAERLIWQDGVVISREVTDLYNAKTPYVGDAVAVGRLLRELDRWYGPLGFDYTISLQTSSQPYGLTIQQTDPRYLFPAISDKAGRYSLCLLALVENLDQVTWAYTDGNGQTERWTVTKEDAQDMLRRSAETRDQEAYWKDSIKEYAASILDFQKMCDLLP